MNHNIKNIIFKKLHKKKLNEVHTQLKNNFIFSDRIYVPEYISILVDDKEIIKELSRIC